MVPPSPARTADTDRRQLLITAARKLFTSKPYDQVTTAEIADDAGVAYGLIAHHFGNKRGLYRAVMNEIAVEIATHQLAPPPKGASPRDQLRHAVRNHIAHIDTYAGSFVAFVRGNLGADADQQAAIDELRWIGAQRILLALGIAAPVPPALRTAMRGWVGYLDEMMIDRILHRDVDIDTVVELACAALVTTLRTALKLDPSIDISPEGVQILNELE
ncbi:TetR/AcrR family transcriptional regulator [[Mycobacterium] nativiensis]|uniref:TetR/AcrR family transcriptional regulator n=1 Tax=[Mycobacterium] nativiensis TaxID=2855503 RepID=A0ABU5XSY1_9MYCO|nr:TetR/AcrR family transcriptional regulator [Mycolicibacter sp. MYC340]MEB3031074.1 TetR/AcrR family transcriptional regulator [Mycolicibacter sp. MYC340]